MKRRTAMAIFLLWILSPPLRAQETTKSEAEVKAEVDQTLALVKEAKGHVDDHDYQAGFVSYSKALSVATSLKFNLLQGTIQLQIADLVSRTGDYDTAIKMLDKTLPMFKRGEDDQFLVVGWNLQGRLFAWQRQYNKSLIAYKDALEAAQRLNDTQRIGETLDGMSWDYIRQHKYQDSLKISSQALLLCPKMLGQLACESTTFYIRALSQLGLEQFSESCKSSLIAIGAANRASDQERKATGDTSFMNCAAHLDYTQLGLLSGIDAINLNQQLRAHMKGLRADVRSAFIWRNASSYQWVADALFKQGRLEQAEYILDLLKLAEIEGDLTASASPTSSENVILPLIPAEQNALSAFYSRASVISQAVDSSLAQNNRAIKFPVSADDQAAITAYVNGLASGTQDIHSAMTQIEHLVAPGGSGEIGSSIPQSDIKEIVQSNVHGVLAVYTLVLDDHIGVAVTTRKSSRYFRLKQEGKDIGGSELNHLVDSVVDEVGQSSSEPWDELAHLYKILIQPLKPSMAEAAAESPDRIPTILWCTDSYLRTLPLNALYDGKEYLLEQARSAYLIPGLHGRLLSESQNQSFKILAMGKSTFAGLPELTTVPSELDTVAHDTDVEASHGPISGTILQDDRFTLQAFKSGLTANPTIIHFATHYIFRTADPDHSFLALTDEHNQNAIYKLSLTAFQTDPQINFDGVSLVTISACSTGQPDTTMSLRDLDSLSIIVQKRGAHAVLASAWSIDDAGTTELMGDFYQRWSSNPTSGKLEALRLAQLDLLYGRIGAQTSPDAALFAQSPDHHNGRFSKPYYWAPYTLSGDFR